MFWLTALLGAGLATAAPSPDLLANLDYGSFQGAYSASYNLSYWQKIPFAAPPIGENRFRAPQPPLPITNGTYDSSQSFDECPQRTANGSEDCLYLGLYSRPWTTGSALRPVVVTFFGGAFIEGSASFGIPPSAYPILNVSASTDIIFVYPNYRTNAFGFLPGKKIANDPSSDTNAGLRDQEAVLEWVQKYAPQFGGDPNNVAVWGQSAGAGSVVAQVIARKHDPPLFNKAWASSPFWPKAYRYDGEESDAIYNDLANLTGCAGPDSLSCLKNVDVQTIREASLIIDARHTYNTSSYTWAPVIGDDFLPLSLTEATATGHVNALSGFGMYNQHEGENFIPPGLNSSTNSGTPPFNSSEASFDGWLRGYLPRFSDCNIAQVKKLYPPQGTAETETYNTTYVRAGLIYRDTVLACPAFWQAEAAPEGSWLGQYTILPATHGSDTYWWNTISTQQKTDPVHYEGYAGAFASFFATSNPNTLKLTGRNVTGVPRLATGKEWVMDAAGFETAKINQLKQRCHFWRKLAHKVPF